MSHVSRRQFLRASAALAAASAVGRFARAAWGRDGGSFGTPTSLQNPPKDAAVDFSKLAAGNTQFGLELYAKLRDDAGNLFLSPFSISTALGLAAAGAKGETLGEMTKVLHLPENAAPAFGGLLKSLNEAPPAGQKRPFELAVANALWAQNGYPWKDEYKKLAAESFAAGVNDADFKANPEAARATINGWVEKETREKIKDLLPAGSVTNMTRLVLTNAIYFKGDWFSPFKKDATKDLPFILADGTKADVPLMHRVGGYPYFETDGFQVLDLPYAGNRVSMTVILPKKPDALPAVEKELTGDKLAEVLKGLKFEKEVHVHLPRFKAEKTFNLNAPLQALGMKTAFAKADFSGMHSGGEELSITDVVHKAFVDVNEEGTEAAGATGAVIGVASVTPPTPPKHFKADHPFLFLIRDAKTQSVLFLGRLTNPKG